MAPTRQAMKDAGVKKGDVIFKIIWLVDRLLSGRHREGKLEKHPTRALTLMKRSPWALHFKPVSPMASLRPASRCLTPLTRNRNTPVECDYDMIERYNSTLTQ